jgi:hypothetical protein
MLEQIDDRLVEEYAKIAAMPAFRASVDLAKKFLRIENAPPENGPRPKKAAKAKRKPTRGQKKVAKRSKAKK